MGGFGAGSGFGEPAKVSAGKVADDKALLTQDESELARPEAEKEAAKQALKAAQRKNDPELVAYARELRDRWQEHVTMNPLLLEGKQNGRYTVGRLLGGSQGNPPNSDMGHSAGQTEVVEPKRLDAA